MTNCTKNFEINKLLKETLSIEDSNIELFSISKMIIKGVESKVYSGNLYFNQEYCPKCGSYHPKLYIHGYKNSLIKLPKVSEFNTFLKLKKTRYKCLECNKTFVPETKLVSKGCFISNKVKDAITYRLTKMLTMKYIASDLNVSPHTVLRVLDTYQKAAAKTTYKLALPSVLHFDEFKSTKDAKGNMSFVMMNGENKRLLDIVENRQKRHLDTYFSYYTEEAKKMVKFIVIDMYEPYMSLIKETFPNASIVLDRFHIVQNLTRAFLKTRIEIMKKTKNKKLKKILKKYWKIIQQPSNDLSMKRYKHPSFNYAWKSNKEVIDYIIDNSEEFRINYEYYQKVLFALKYKDIDKLKEVLKLDRSLISEQLKTCMKTYDKYLKHIEQALEVTHNNGIIEGTISKFKKLKTISCGFRKFERLKTRIFIMETLIKCDKKTRTISSSGSCD